MAMAGADWLPVVYEFTLNSSPTKKPLKLYRRA